MKYSTCAEPAGREGERDGGLGDWPKSILWLAVNFLFPATRELLLVCLASLLGLVISLPVDR